jgi:hypothetical protein
MSGCSSEGVYDGIISITMQTELDGERFQTSVAAPILKMRQMGCSETSVICYQLPQSDIMKAKARNQFALYLPTFLFLVPVLV